MSASTAHPIDLWLMTGIDREMCTRQSIYKGLMHGGVYSAVSGFNTSQGKKRGQD